MTPPEYWGTMVNPAMGYFIQSVQLDAYKAGLKRSIDILMHHPPQAQLLREELDKLPLTTMVGVIVKTGVPQ